MTGAITIIEEAAQNLVKEFITNQNNDLTSVAKQPSENQTNPNISTQEAQQVQTTPQSSVPNTTVQNPLQDPDQDPQRLYQEGEGEAGNSVKTKGCCIIS